MCIYLRQLNSLPSSRSHPFKHALSTVYSTTHHSLFSSWMWTFVRTSLSTLLFLHSILSLSLCIIFGSHPRLHVTIWLPVSRGLSLRQRTCKQLLTSATISKQRRDGCDVSAHGPVTAFIQSNGFKPTFFTWWRTWPDGPSERHQSHSLPMFIPSSAQGRSEVQMAALLSEADF